MYTNWVSVLISTCCLSAMVGNEVQWPEYRGLHADGVSPNHGLPQSWSETENVRWKIPTHGYAWSSPVVWDNQVWLTTASKDGHQLEVIACDRETGKILIDRKIFDIEKPQPVYHYNTYASPTPAIEAGRIFVTYGAAGTACLNTKNGEIMWKRQDLIVTHYRGAGSSAILDETSLYLHFDGIDKQFVIALDKATGKTRWQTDRSIDFRDLDPEGKPRQSGDERKSFATARLATFDGHRLLLSSGAKAFYAYDPTNGAEIWRVAEQTCHSAASRPVLLDGLVFVPTGFSNGQLLAIRPGKQGENIDANSETNLPSQLRVVWKTRRNVPKKPSLIIVNNLLFGIDDSGIATCWDPRTGAVHWNERIGGNHSASPVAADGKIYFFSEDGKGTVIEGQSKFKILATNKLSEGTMASPAISDRALIVRGTDHLYCLTQDSK